MKPKDIVSKENSSGSTHRADKPEESAEADLPKHMRRLGCNELVSQGDFVANGRCGFVPWEGPGGFRADSFVKAIYRRAESLSTATKKSK